MEQSTHSLSHSPNGHHTWDQAKSKAVAKKPSLQFSPVADRIQLGDNHLLSPRIHPAKMNAWIGGRYPTQDTSIQNMNISIRNLTTGPGAHPNVSFNSISCELFKVSFYNYGKNFQSKKKVGNVHPSENLEAKDS